MRKRKRDDDLNELLPSGPPNEGASMGSLEFNEIFDEEASSLRAHSSLKERCLSFKLTRSNFRVKLEASVNLGGLMPVTLRLTYY